MQELKLVFDIGHILLHSWELVFSPPSAKCPDCICAVCPVLTQEKIPEALTSALRFAQAQCLQPSSVTSTDTTWSYSLFWLGLLVGCVSSSVCWGLFILLSKCIRGSFTSPRPVQPAPQPLPVPQVNNSLALGDEPANPRTLRQLGLLR